MNRRLNVVDRNPYASLAGAVGVGFVLGGGLFTPLAERIVGAGLRVGLRMAGMAFLRQQLLHLSETITTNQETTK